jgi:hypothetical protein
MLMPQAFPTLPIYSQAAPSGDLTGLLHPSFVQQLLLQLSSTAARSEASHADLSVGAGDVTAYLGGLEQAAELMVHSVKPATQKAREKAILEFQGWMQRVVKVTVLRYLHYHLYFPKAYACCNLWAGTSFLSTNGQGGGGD